MRRSIPIATLKGCLALALWHSIALTHAAPATSEELSAAPDNRAAGTPATSPVMPVVSAVPQSKSVELLLQLQDQPQPGVADGRNAAALARKAAAPASATAGSNIAVGAADADSTPLAALKNSMLRDTVPRQADTGGAAQAPVQGMAGGSGAIGQPMGTLPRRESGESPMSHPLIRYIRENRMTVVTICVAVLAAIWLTATFSMRRSR